jgi:ferredoxin-thioredoxin reductase catalytic subunit
MNDSVVITEPEVDQLLAVLSKIAEDAGYHLNPDPEFTRELLKSLLINERRYGYQACPCRLASGDKNKDMDITCPCDYRDPDLNEYGCCFCALYVSEAVVNGTQKIASIPERRSKDPQTRMTANLRIKQLPSLGPLAFPVWRCKVCGYLCARENPPGVCPICKAGYERFEKFL